MDLKRGRTVNPVQGPRKKPVKSVQTEGYGSISPARSQKIHHRRHGIAVALIAGVLLGTLVAIGVFLVVPLVTHSSFGAPTQRVALTTNRVESVLNSTGIERPELSSYSYVNATNLIGPTFSDVAIAEDEAQAAQSETKTATATATFRNGDLTASIPVSIDFTYDSGQETWLPGPIQTGDMKVTPLQGPNATAICESLNELLSTSYGSVVSTFNGITPSISSSLNAEGGTITANYSKEDGRRLLTCTVTLLVNWEENRGWVPTISSVSDIHINERTPNYTLTCKVGDLVELSGLVSGQAGNLILRFDDDLRLIVDGNTWDINSIAFTLPDDISANDIIGAHVIITGVLGPEAAGNNLPVGVQVKAVQVG